MTDTSSSDEVKVGYKRPPLSTRFRPGVSGNPRGRQKGVRNFATDVKAILTASVSLNDKGKTKRVSTQEAMLLRLKERALKGDPRALDQLIRLAQIFNDDGRTEPLVGQDMAADDRGILDAYTEAVRSRSSSVPDAASLPDGTQGSDANG